MSYSSIQLREIFHLAFLRVFTGAVPTSSFALKGGTNLRFFFGSMRYSEDMDIDVSGIEVYVLIEKVMGILESSRFVSTLGTFGVEQVRLPDMRRAKQTETVQRFKLGLLTAAGEDLATKIEFSRRGMDEGIKPESVDGAVLADYRMPRIIVPHYLAHTAAVQKLQALLLRKTPQTRDVFDLHLLTSYPGALQPEQAQSLTSAELKQIRETVYLLEYERYRDEVVSYLAPEDRTSHGSKEAWDEIRLKVLEAIDELDQSGN